MEPETKLGRRVSVFEAINETLQEFYVGTTSLSGEPKLTESLLSLYIPHWRPDHKTARRFVASEMDLEDALQYVDTHAKSLARTGWKVLTESSVEP